MAKTDDKIRCSCEGWRSAERSGFVRATTSGAFLADRERGVAGQAGWTSLYGPAVAHCPFCGTPLARLPLA